MFRGRWAAWSLENCGARPAREGRMSRPRIRPSQTSRTHADRHVLLCPAGRARKERARPDAARMCLGHKYLGVFACRPGWSAILFLFGMALEVRVVERR